MSSEEQFAQGVENRAKVLVANGENNEFTTVENSELFETASVWIGIQTSKHDRFKSELASCRR